MSVSKHFLNAWNYNPEDLSSHQTRAGLALLPDGIEWRTSKAFAKVLNTSKTMSVQQILAEADDSASLAAAATHGPMPAKPKPSSPVPSETWTIQSAPAEASEQVPLGMVVVDSQGEALTVIQDISTCKDIAERGMPMVNNSPSDERQGLQASRQRTTHLWKKINPGCMPAYSDLPLSTSHDLMVLDYSTIPPVDKRVHRQKNEFTEYTEQGASTMKALISDKK